MNSLEFDRIESSFAAIAANPYRWQRRLLLDSAATYHGIVKSSFRQAFELWKAERVEQGVVKCN